MELTKLALIKTVMPCVKLEIAEQALQNESNPREQLHQKINIQGGVEDEEEPSTVKVRIKISVSTDSGNVAFEVCRESTFQMSLAKNGKIAKMLCKMSKTLLSHWHMKICSDLLKNCPKVPGFLRFQSRAMILSKRMRVSKTGFD